MSSTALNPDGFYRFGDNFVDYAIAPVSTVIPSVNISDQFGGAPQTFMAVTLHETDFVQSPLAVGEGGGGGGLQSVTTGVPIG